MTRTTGKRIPQQPIHRQAAPPTASRPTQPPTSATNLSESHKQQQHHPSRTINLRIAWGKSASRWTEGGVALDRQARHRTGELLPRQGGGSCRGLLLR